MGMKYISSDKDTQFTGTLAQHADELESIDMPADWQTAGIYKCTISELMVQISQIGLDLELIFWRSASANNDSDMDLTKVVSRVSLAALDATDRISGAGQYYYANPLVQNIEYIDEDHSGKIHVSLINRDVTAYSGSMVLTMGCTPYFS